MTSTLLESLILYILLLLGALFMLITAVRARRAAVPLRPIAAYSALPLAVGEGVESDKTLHISLGASAVGGASTFSALSAADILYYITERAAIGDRLTLATTSDPLTLGLAQDSLRRAYRARRLPSKYRPTLARWYPQGPRSLAFAAGVGTLVRDEDTLASVLVGDFGPEMMLIAESAQRADRPVIAQSDRIEGQAVAFAVSDTPLIGEELYVANAYLLQTPIGIGGVVALDVLRYLTIAAIIAAAALAFISGGR